MNVLVLTNDFLPSHGGVAQFLDNLCIELSRLEHYVDVLTPFRRIWPKKFIKKPYKIYRYVLSKKLSSIIPIFQTLALHWKYRYDVAFIGHFMTTHAIGALALHLLCRVPYVILSHGNDLNYSLSTKIDKIVASLLLKNASLMLGNSRFTEKLIRQAGFEGRVEILNPGVDATQFYPEVDHALVHRLYKLKNRQVLLTTARLVPKKNVHGALRALSQVIKQFPSVLYLVAGEGPELQKLVALTEELNLSHHVRFLGHVDNTQLPALYCASQVLMMPSLVYQGDAETFGISYTEASACGKPVIAGRTGGTMDAVIDGETGLLVNPENVDEIAEAILRLLDDHELAHRLGKNGRTQVERERSWKKVGERLETFLKHL